MQPVKARSKKDLANECKLKRRSSQWR